MYQRDYILRMISMIMDLIAGILGMIKKGKLDEAKAEIDRTFSDFLNEDSSFFLSFPPGELTSRLLKEHNYTSGHLEILAWLLDTEAELSFAKGDPEQSLEMSRRSLILFEFLDTESRTFSPERSKKMSDIKKRIDLLCQKKN